MRAIIFFSAMLIAGAIGLAILLLAPLTTLITVLLVIYALFVILALIFAAITLINDNDRRC